MKKNIFHSIRFKLSAAMVMLTLAILLISFSAKLLTDELKDGVNRFGTNYLPAISAVLNADRDLYQAKEAELNYLLGKRDSSVKKDFNENADQAFERMNQYRALMKEYPDIMQQLDTFDSAFNNWKTKAERTFTLVDNGRIDEAETWSDQQAGPAFASLRGLYDLAGEALDTKSRNKREHLAQRIEEVSLSLGIFILIVLTIAGALTYFTPKLLVNSITQLTHSIKEISQGNGDLTLRINSQRKDELGELASVFDDFVANLETLITDIRQRASLMNADAQTLHDSANNSMAIVNKQSQGVEMIASAVFEFNTAIREVAEHAQQTSSESAKTVDISSNGLNIINDSVVQIQNLSHSVSNAEQVISKLALESESIASVLDVIRGIADQTNLLALNAAIEAARAGDHGRGFAVVSDEVRSLASKTQASTEEIQSMIEKLQSGVSKAVSSIRDGSSQVSASVELVESTQEILNAIGTSANQVNDMAIQIATATEQQSQVTDEINQNLTHLNDQNMTAKELSQSSLGIATSFKNMAEDLFNKMKRFNVS
ncbi:methyl-accepting chemotaxis protein [Neptuniibacter sp. 2_MG-2023]|uniref:methyl-accepting chemotaxis protein n=1 Tax=Neptuniibacter sp. 2_MG-2023 TaxID=3062671 RepID=UPI0026E35057|nr:methyl-accepting chemotaxis protein [Neptuniibacter sp. 2_MG-2023]MDO6513640.1 methyl-accepting chemotaxis protein [Neptuniibacter sp. 2_MG-2023]